jgi:hypothetical protein
MDQKDLIKYGLLALGAYLIYKYIEDNGGVSAVLSGTPVTTPVLPAATGTAALIGTTPAIPVATTPVGTTSKDAAGNTYTWNGTAWTMATQAPAATAPPAAVTAPSISQQMVAAATAAGVGTTLNLDQWSYYYQVVTGNAFPVDPGTIPPGIYQGAGIVDRTTPTDIGTWLAIMQNQAPQLGLSAFYGPGSVKYYAPWLM